jgi:tetratricopeptide (TPR) repeat protein
LPIVSRAQIEPEAVASPATTFQEAFYDALTQKGIENYDKAIVLLEKCLTIEPNIAIVFSELGRNYLAQRDYPAAFDSFEKATKIDPKNRWFWVGMYDVCYETRNFNQAIEIVTKLIEFRNEYKEDLVSLYMNTQQLDKALDLINELNDSKGKLELRENYKNQILRDPKYQAVERSFLLEQIKKNPKVESNYVALISLYYQSNQEEKVFEIVKKLELEIPTSDWAHVTLFKYYIKQNSDIEAVKSMKIVLASAKIDSKIKHRILNEFLIFCKDKPQLETDLDQAISYFDHDKEVPVAKEIGKFYHNKKNWDKAIRYYQLFYSKNPEDIESATLLLQMYTEKEQFDVIAIKAEALIQTFPSQPEFYYYLGLAYNQLKLFDKAKDSLEIGIDFIIENPKLEINFNIQIGEAYSGLGDNKKKEFYFLKAEQGIKQIKK